MRDEALYSQFIRRVGPVVGKLCRTSKVYDAESSDIDRKTDESPIFAAPPVPGNPVPHKIYYDSGDKAPPRPFRVPTKKPEYQDKGEQGGFRVPTKRPEFSAPGHAAHEPHAFPAASGSEHRPLFAPMPFQQAIPQMKHHGHGHSRKR